MLPMIFGENLFDDFFTDPFDEKFFRRNPLYGRNEKNIMKTDVREHDDRYELAVDLPGFKKEDIKVSEENGYLTITAQKALDKDEKNSEGKYIRRERYAGSCSRSFYIGSELKREDIKAKYEDGILTVSFPKAQPALPENESPYIAIE